MTTVPIFSIPHDLAKFAPHYDIHDTSAAEFKFATSSRVIPSPEEEVREVSTRVKRWMKRMAGNLPTTKEKFANATRNMRLLKSVVDSSAILQRLAQEQKLKFCVPCNNFSILPAAYVPSKSKLQNSDEVGKLAAKTVDWLCHQRKTPPNVAALQTQIETFGSTKEVSSDLVWAVLEQEGIVNPSGDTVQYNLASIHVEERF